LNLKGATAVTMFNTQQHCGYATMKYAARQSNTSNAS
jgi:hypothetical protein